MAAGAWAGLVGTVLGYPLDVVKGRMQTGKGIAESGAKASFGAQPHPQKRFRPVQSTRGVDSHLAPSPVSSSQVERSSTWPAPRAWPACTEASAHPCA